MDTGHVTQRTAEKSNLPRHRTLEGCAKEGKEARIIGQEDVCMAGVSFFFFTCVRNNKGHIKKYIK